MTNSNIGDHHYATIMLNLALLYPLLNQVNSNNISLDVFSSPRNREVLDLLLTLSILIAIFNFQKLYLKILVYFDIHLKLLHMCLVSMYLMPTIT